MRSVIDKIHYGLKVVFCFRHFYCLPLSSLCKTTYRHWTHINVCRVTCGGVSSMLLVLTTTFYFHYNIWGCMCSTGPFQYRWLNGYIYSSCYYHHQIGSIHLSHCYHIFPWLCAWDYYYIIFCHLLHIYSGKAGIFFHYYCAVFDESKYSDTFWLADRICEFVHYTICLSSLCKLIWRHWTYMETARYILSSVWVWLSIFSRLSIIQYVGLCVFSLPISFVMIEIIYILCLIIIIIKSDVWTIIHCLGLGHETMVCAVCLFIFLKAIWIG